MMERWYKIDNAGKIFQAVKKPTNSSVFRVSMALHDEINPDLLQNAVDITMKRFPSLAVKLRKGVFWDFLEGNEKSLSVQKEINYPCFPIDSTTNNGYLIRVLYFNCRISVEIFHSLMDGTGALEFLKTLAYQYLCLCGNDVEADVSIMLPDELPSKFETEDSFEKYYQHVKVNRHKEPKAYQIDGTRFERMGNNVIHGVLNAGKLNAVAKQNGATITEYLTAILIHSIYSQSARYEINHEPVRVAIPVNLRKLFPSKTIRNFFAVVNVGIPISDSCTFDTIVKEVSLQLKEKTKREYLSAEIAHNIKFQKMLSARFVPLAIKYIAMRYAFKYLGENLKTITLTNLGNVRLPDSMSKYVDQLEIVMYPTEKSPINCGVCSVNNQLTITFSRSILETDIIKCFFRLLTEHAQVDVNVYSNNWGVNQ